MLADTWSRLVAKCHFEYTPCFFLAIYICVSFYAFGEKFCYYVLSREGVSFELKNHKLLLGFQVSTLLYGLPAMAILCPLSRRRNRSLGSRLTFCRWCHDVMDSTTIHCFLCDTCCPQYYTHSSLFNRCIGRSNMRDFLQFFFFFGLNNAYVFQALLSNFDQVDMSHLSHAIVAYYLAVTLLMSVIVFLYFSLTVFFLAFDLKPDEPCTCSGLILRAPVLRNLRHWLGPYGLFAVFVPKISLGVRFSEVRRCASGTLQQALQLWSTMRGDSAKTYHRLNK